MTAERIVSIDPQPDLGNASVGILFGPSFVAVLLIGGSMKKEIFTFSLRDITEIAVLVAMAVVLDTFVKIPLGGEGGSLNFSMVPMFVVALRHGPFKAFIASGVIYGLITCLLDGYGFITYPLDYLVAFGSTCVLGFFGAYINNNFNKRTRSMVNSVLIIALSITLWAFIRLFASTLDGMLVYKYSFAASLAYNALYVVPTLIFDIPITIALVIPLTGISKRYPSSYLKAYKKDNNQETEVEENTEVSDNSNQE